MRVDFLFFCPPSCQRWFCQNCGPKREQKGSGGGGVLSLLRGFSCADWTHDVGLHVVVRGGLKHTWKCLQADMKARFTHKEGGIKVLWSVTGSLQAERNKRTRIMCRGGKYVIGSNRNA